MFFFFNDTATTEIYTLSLHDALPICSAAVLRPVARPGTLPGDYPPSAGLTAPLLSWRYDETFNRLLGQSSLDRKSTRLNSSHSQISYAVLCLKKKNSG